MATSLPRDKVRSGELSSWRSVVVESSSGKGRFGVSADVFSHGAWLEEGALLRDAGRLAGIPGVLIHGRLDLSSPLDTAWELARAWPDTELTVVDGAGHLGNATTHDHVLRALNRFTADA